MKRRNFLQTTGLAALGMTYSNDLIANSTSKCDAIINIYLPGGMAAQESWDPKPHISAEFKGPHNAIKTNVSGIIIGSMFPKMAKVMDKATIIRSFTHGEAAHERGTASMFTGYSPSPALKYPSMGSVVSHESNPDVMPSYISIPNVPNESAGTGYMASMYGPFALGSDPAVKGFKVRDLSLPKDITPDRWDSRKNLLEIVNQNFSDHHSQDIDSIAKFYKQGFDLIGSKKAQEAFSLNNEPTKLRDNYGRNTAGQRFLLARRLVENGAKYVTVTYGSWDMHDNIKQKFEQQAPALDQAIAMLLQDLDDRGMLDRTMVVVTSEFGRTPQINKTNGRDHWPRVFSGIVAGGGINRGSVYGESSQNSDAVEKDPVSPGDLSATIFNQLGYSHDKELMAPGGRPISLTRGKILEGLTS